jgi:hypothetical protein
MFSNQFYFKKVAGVAGKNLTFIHMGKNKFPWVI